MAVAGMHRAVVRTVRVATVVWTSVLSAKLKVEVDEPVMSPPLAWLKKKRAIGRSPFDETNGFALNCACDAGLIT